MQTSLLNLFKAELNRKIWVEQNFSEGIQSQWKLELKMRHLLISAFRTYSLLLTLGYCSNGRTILLLVLVRKENIMFSFYVLHVVLVGELSYPK